MISDKEDAVIYSRGYNRNFVKIDHLVVEEARKMIEKVDSFEGFMILHATGGGTGSGLTSRVAETLSLDYCKKPKITYTLWPSPEQFKSTVEVYNSILCLDKLIDNSCLNIMLDNKQLYKKCQKLVSRTPL